MTPNRDERFAMNIDRIVRTASRGSRRRGNGCRATRDLADELRSLGGDVGGRLRCKAGREATNTGATSEGQRPCI